MCVHVWVCMGVASSLLPLPVCLHSSSHSTQRACSGLSWFIHQNSSRRFTHPEPGSSLLTLFVFVLIRSFSIRSASPACPCFATTSPPFVPCLDSASPCSALLSCYDYMFSTGCESPKISSTLHVWQVEVQLSAVLICHFGFYLKNEIYNAVGSAGSGNK